MTYPDPATLVDQPQGSRLLEVRRSPRSLLGLIFLFIGLVLVTFFSSHLVQQYQELNQILAGFDVRYVALFPALVLLELLRRYHNDLYIFSNNRVTHLHGRFSLAYHVPVVKYADIRSINVFQTVWGRILNYGDVVIGTAAQQGYELTITGVKDPERLAYLIDSLRTFSLRENSS